MYFKDENEFYREYQDLHWTFDINHLEKEEIVFSHNDV